MTAISKIIAHEVLDSRGNPTIEAEVITESGAVGNAMVPSGASTGVREALELRDMDNARYLGKGVLIPISNIHNEIAPTLLGEEVTEQAKIDKIMIDLDGTSTKKILVQMQFLLFQWRRPMRQQMKRIFLFMNILAIKDLFKCQCL